MGVTILFANFEVRQYEAANGACRDVLQLGHDDPHHLLDLFQRLLATAGLFHSSNDGTPILTTFLEGGIGIGMGRGAERVGVNGGKTESGDEGDKWSGQSIDKAGDDYPSTQRESIRR